MQCSGDACYIIASGYRDIVDGAIFDVFRFVLFACPADYATDVSGSGRIDVAAIISVYFAIGEFGIPPLLFHRHTMNRT